MNILSYASYHRGGRHIRSGKPVQDCARSCVDGDNVFLAVSDGHGSDAHFLSDVGAEIAVEIAIGCMRQVAKDTSTMPRGRFGVGENQGASRARELFKHIQERWCKAVLQHWDACVAGTPIAQQGPRSSRAYGCTLMGAFRTKDYWMAFQLGDGDVVAFSSEGDLVELLPEDSRCMGALTTSLCSEGPEDFRFVGGQTPPEAMFLLTDGISDLYPGRRELWLEALAEIVVESDAYLSLLTEELESRAAEPEADDMSLACWIDAQIDPKVLASLRAQILEHINAQSAEASKRLKEVEEKIRQLEDNYPVGDDVECMRVDVMLSSYRRQANDLRDFIEALVD